MPVLTAGSQHNQHNLWQDTSDCQAHPCSVLKLCCAVLAMRCSSLSPLPAPTAVDQRAEASGRLGMRVSVNSMAQDPINQQYIATGGGDSLGKVYQQGIVAVATAAASSIWLMLACLHYTILHLRSLLPAAACGMLHHTSH